MLLIICSRAAARSSNDRAGADPNPDPVPDPPAGAPAPVMGERERLSLLRYSSRLLDRLRGV